MSCISASFQNINISTLSCISGSFNTFYISTLTCKFLSDYINTSTTTNVNNYNSSLVLYSNGSLSAAVTKYNLP